MNRTNVPSRADAGFTLVELLVSLAVTTVLILGVLATFDFSARMNRVQMHVADMQQSLRIAQNEVVKLSRMAGRGRLPANISVQVTNNVAAGATLVPSRPTTEILEGTDVLRVRGVVNSTVYQIDGVNPAAVFGFNEGDGTGFAVVFPTAQGVPQNLAALLEKAVNGESLVLEEGGGRVAVARIQAAAMDASGNLRINFQKHPNEAALNAVLDSSLKKLVALGILEEYAFYVRVRGGEAPTLARARMEPGSNLPYRGDLDNVTLDLADNIIDLQAAYAIGVAGQPELRVTTVARTDRADPGEYLAPPLPATIEDHAYPVSHPFNTAAARRYRWRLLRTDINLRNL